MYKEFIIDENLKTIQMFMTVIDANNAPHTQATE